jgi:hypothetical protein
MKRALLLLIPALLALPVQSFALSPGSPGSPEEQATKLYKEATKALNEGRDEAAAEKLREAFRLHRVHEYVCNLGMLELNLGHGPKAAEALFTCRRLLPAKESAIGPMVERLLSKAKALSGTLRIQANVAEADVLLGGKIIGKTPLNAPAFVDPGRHIVELRAPGYEPNLRIVDLPAGSDFEIDFTLEPAELRAPPLPAKPSPPVPLPTSKAAESAQSSLSPKSLMPRGFEVRPALLITGLSLAIVGISVGASSLVAATAKASEARHMNFDLSDTSSATCTAHGGRTCAELSERANSAVTFTVVGFAGIALATAGGGILTYELLRAEARRNVSMSASLVGAPRGGLLTFRGAW